MTLTELRERVQKELFGDGAYNIDDEMLIKKIDDAMRNISMETTPQKWVTDDINTEALRYYNGSIVRKWELPTRGSDSIDIDKELYTALSSQIAFNMAIDAQNKQRLIEEYKNNISGYNWNMYSLEQLDIAIGY